MSARRVLTSVALTLAVAGCSSSNSAASTSNSAQPSISVQAPDITSAVTLAAGEPSAADAVLADGTVTRAEIDAIYLSYTECLRAAGVKGEVAWDLDLSPALHSSLYVPGDNAQGDQLAKLDGRCMAAVDKAANAYAATADYGDAADETQKTRLLQCLETLKPGIGKLIDSRLGYDEMVSNFIGSAPFQELSESNGADLQHCLQINYGPWRSL